MVCNDKYEIECCGSAMQFNFHTENSGVTNLMIWRPVGGGMYDFIGDVSYTVTATDKRMCFYVLKMLLNFLKEVVALSRKSKKSTVYFSNFARTFRVSK